MSRLSSIEDSLTRINEAAFQELCDHYLALRHADYKTISRRGSQIGKDKTIRGTPDSFFQLDDGTYLFMEATTQQTDLLKKFKDDLTSCADQALTNIPVSKVREVILCFNSRFKQVEELTDFSKSKGLGIPRLIGLDELAPQIHLHHRDLASIYLGLPLDTGQIVPIPEYVKHYNKGGQGAGTPLDNPFLHREAELAVFQKSLKEHDVVVIAGPAGTGKTRIAIQGIELFLKAHTEFNAYAVLNRHAELFADLGAYFNDHSKNILFIDDANRLDRILQIVGFVKTFPAGTLKIVLTVRDYALTQVQDQFANAHVIRLSSWTKEQIIDMIKIAPFGILNPDYQKQILKISALNPRLAIMAARLGKTHDLSALHQVYDLYDEYFKTFVHDNDLLKDPKALKTLGIIAFFHDLPLNDRETVEPTLTDFSISYDDFISSCDKLEGIELVEIDFESVAVSEQTLSTFFFYKTFFKDSLLPLAVLLEKYYDSHASRLNDTIIPSVNTFGYANVKDKFRPLLLKKLGTISDEKSKIKFLEQFWFYLEEEIYECVISRIQSTTPDPPANSLESILSEKDEYIDLLAFFFRYADQAPKAIEVAIKYVNKYDSTVAILAEKILGTLLYDVKDEQTGFRRQQRLFELISVDVENSIPVQELFFSISNRFLKFKFE
ncbi:MAG TPA: hypothetical protein VG737_04875, partial [Cyclobacteriaceae bacterium]|nr:hypothetical protein [Cyclobacteriaceae bacterium]